jgi:hypothetical protein
LNRVISAGLVRGTVVISSRCWSMTPQGGLFEFDGDRLAGVGEADLDALAADLDAAAAGDLPPDGQAGLRERVRSGEADALQPVPLAGLDGAGQRPPQDAVLRDDVHDLAVDAPAGALPTGDPTP